MNEKIEKKRYDIRRFDLVMVFFVAFLGALFFLCIARSINGDTLLNPWISAMICAIIFETFLSLFAVTVGKKKLITPIIIIAFLPSIIFMPVIGHIIVVVIAVLIVKKGLYMMRSSLFNMLKINISTVVRSGIVYVSLALVIVVTSQYYFFIKNNTEVIFDAKYYINASNRIIDYVAKKSGIKNVAISEMTVDEFLEFMLKNVYKPAQIQEDAESSRSNIQETGMLVRWVGQASGINIKKIKAKANNLIIGQMRISMSEISNHNLDGSEMIVDIFSEILSTQINNIMTQNTFLRENKAKVFTIVFFLIIFSLAWIVRIVSIFFTRFIFMLFREFKIVHIAKTKRDAEVIVL